MVLQHYVRSILQKRSVAVAQSPGGITNELSHWPGAVRGIYRHGHLTSPTRACAREVVAFANLIILVFLPSRSCDHRSKTKVGTCPWVAGC